MSGSTLYEVNGDDVSGTTEYVYYDNGGVYTLLGSSSVSIGTSVAWRIPTQP